MNGLNKDVFIVHSEGDKREAALAGALVPRLLDVDISVWLYEDWNWENQVYRRSHGTYRSSGQLKNLDYERYLDGSPMPFRAPISEIDESALRKMLHESKVVLMCEPRLPNTLDLHMSRDAGRTWIQAPAPDPVFPPQVDYGWQLTRTKGRMLLTDVVDAALEPHEPPYRWGITRVRRLSQNAERWEDVTPCACALVFNLNRDTDNEGVLAGTAITNNTGQGVRADSTQSASRGGSGCTPVAPKISSSQAVSA